MRLREWQDGFAEALLDPDDNAPALSRYVGGPAGLSPARRIAIYRANVIGALSRALENSFPVCGRIVGARGFGALARAFATAHPAVHHDLGRYGTGFPEFLQRWVDGRPGWEDFAYLADLARFEYLRHRAWRAADDSRFDFAAFAAAAETKPADLRLTPSASLGLLASPYPVHRVWEIHQLETPPPQISGAPGHCYLALHRQADQVLHRVLAKSDFQALAALTDGATLSQLDATASGSGDTLAEMLPRLVGLGLVTGFVA